MSIILIYKFQQPPFSQYLQGWKMVNKKWNEAIVGFLKVYYFNTLQQELLRVFSVLFCIMDFITRR